MGTSEPVFSLNFLDLIFYFFITPLVGFPWWFNGKESACLCRRHRRCSFDSWVEKIPWRRKWHPLHYSCLGNPMDRGTWRAIICRCHKRVKHDLATKQQQIPLALPKEHGIQPMNNKCLNNNCVIVVGRIMSSQPPHSQKMSTSQPWTLWLCYLLG